MADTANKDEGTKCLRIAQQALQAGDTARAERFAVKAMKLLPNDEVSGDEWVANSRPQACPVGN